MRGIRRSLGTGAALAGLLLLASCGRTGPGPAAEVEFPRIDLWPGTVPGQPATVRTGCDVLAGPAAEGGKFLVALPDSVHPEHAPIPHNRSERLLFAHLYETLVRVDCAGEIQPGLAESWTCTEDSTVWVFRLREDARFWDGTRITSDDVRRAWVADQADPIRAGLPSPWTWFDARARSITTLDARRLAIRLPEPQARFPMLLAHPATAVAARRAGWTWPVGSGPCRLRASDPAPRPDLVCRPNLHHPRGPVWTRLTFRVLPGADPRDLIAEDPDLFVVRELEDVRFYRDARGYSVRTLPWDRLYLLVLPPEANPDGPGAWLSAAGRIDPARDVTLVDARSWYDLVLPAGGSETCPQTSGPVNAAGSARLEWKLDRRELGPGTVVYPAGLAGARELAHRLTALGGASARAVALPAAAADFVLQWQMSGAVILPLDLDFPDGCLQLATLLGKAAWLQEAALGGPPDLAADTLAEADRWASAAWPVPTEVLHREGLVRPLGLSRPWLVTRGDLGGLGLDYDGTLRLEGLGQAPAPAP